MKRCVLLLLLMVCAVPAVARVVVLDAEARARAGVAVEVIEEQMFGAELRVVGQVIRSPGSTATLKAVLPGRVEEVLASPGEEVRTGDVLVNLHSHELLAVQVELLQANERARIAATRLEAGQELYAVEGISRVDLELREQEALSARLALDGAREELIDHGYPEAALEKVMANKKTDPHLPVAAPIDGVVLELHVENHEWVEEMATLMVLGDPDQIELEIQLPPDQAGSVAAGDEVEFFPVGRPAAAGRATVLTRVPQVDPSTRTLRVRAAIENGQSQLFPGLFVEGFLRHGVPGRAAAIPESAVINLGGHDTVFVRLDADRFESRTVELGMLAEGYYEVRSGVSVGDGVVISGVFLMKSTLLAGESEGE